DDATRTAAGCDLGEFPAHRFRPARNVDALFTQFLLESDMEVSDHERIVRHEDGLVRDWFEVHGRSKRGVRLIIVRTGDCVGSHRNFASTRPSWFATSTWPLRRIVTPRAFAISRTISARSSGASGRALPLRSWNSRECGVRTAFLPTRHFGSAATALIASASRTIGSGMPRTASRIASSVPEASPSPGPMATASTRGVSSMICRRSSRNRRCPTRGCTMNVGEYDATTVAADAGVAMWTRSMPMPREPNPTSAGAPVYGPPAMTRRRPFSPLWLVALGTG